MRPQRRAKRARTSDGSGSTATMPGDSSWRDWGNLPSGPARLIAERVLSADVADYVRFRAVCSGWRRCTDDPQDNALDPKFHPHCWTMLQDVLGRAKKGRYRYSRFQNTTTGERIRMTIRGLDGRDGRTFLAPMAQGLKRTDDVWVVNPITGAHADLPPVTTLISDYPRDLVFPRWPIEVHLGAELSRDLGVVIHIYFGRFRLTGIAWLGDEEWTTLQY